MTARPYAAEDTEMISPRLKELAADRPAIFDCTCDTLIGAKGETIKYPPALGCPIHGTPSDGGCYG